VSCDVGYRPSLAKELVHAREQMLKTFAFVAAADIRPICPIVPLGDRIHRPLSPAAQVLLDPSTQVLHQVKAIGDLPGLRRTLPRRISVDTVSITSDQLNGRSLAQPCRRAYS